MGNRNKCGTNDLTVIGQASEMEVLLAHGDNSTLQRLSIESNIKMQMHHVENVYSVKN